jgi:hypothetical protein
MMVAAILSRMSRADFGESMDMDLDGWAHIVRSVTTIIARYGKKIFP